jgi:ketosteroid isomerase-like protein
MRIAPWAAAAFLLAACAPKAETPEQTAGRLRAESDSARTAIAAANAAWARYVAAGQADSVGLLFAEDAVTYEAGKPAVRGRAAITEDYRTWMAAGTYAFAVTTEKVEASGPIAIETGRNIVTYTPGPNAPATQRMASTDTIKYVTTWRKIDGRWLAANDIGTTDRAPAPKR